MGWMMTLGILLWTIGDLAFVRPWWAATNILLVGGINLVLLTFIDGSIRLVSKLCFYCLLLSLLWLSEPLWAPGGKFNPTKPTALKQQPEEEPQEQIAVEEHNALLKSTVVVEDAFPVAMA